MKFGTYIPEPPSKGLSLPLKLSTAGMTLELLLFLIFLCGHQIIFPNNMLIDHNSSSSFSYKKNYKISEYFLLFDQRISDLCKNAGSWLVVDNTYE